MKRMLLVLAVVLLLGQVVHAQQPDVRRQMAEQLLTVMEVQKTIEQSFAAVKDMQMSQLRSMGMSEANSQKTQAAQAQLMDFLSKAMSWDALKADYITIYAETFTEEELKGLLAFYQSPVGKKYVEKTPELMQKSMMLSQKQMMNLMPQIQEITRQAMQAASPTPAPAAPATPAATAPVAAP